MQITQNQPLPKETVVLNRMAVIMSYFYLDEQSREIGPISLENLKAFRASNVIKDQTLVRPESGGPWTAFVAVVGTNEAPDAAKLRAEAAKVMSATFDDAKAALALLATDPVGGLAPAYEKLGPKRSGAVGIFFMAVFGLVGANFINHQIGALTSLSYGMVNASIDTVSFSKLLMVATASAVAWFCALALARLVNQRGGRWEGDAFIAGAVSLVWTLELLLATFVGWKNLEVWGMLVLTAICITVLQIFVGLTRISGLNDARATFAVPVVLVVEVWLTKVIFVAVAV
jgi:hypothetical protein